MKTCCVRGCENELEDYNVNFVPLPENPNRLAYWLRLIYRENWQFKSRTKLDQYRICSEHFLPEHIKKNGEVETHAIPIKNIQEAMDGESDDESYDSDVEQDIVIRNDDNMTEEVYIKEHVDITDEVYIKEEVDISQGLVKPDARPTQDLYQEKPTKEAQSVSLSHHELKVTRLNERLTECMRENAILKRKLNDTNGSAAHRLSCSVLAKLRKRLQACTEENTRLQTQIKKNLFSTVFIKTLQSCIEGRGIQSNYTKRAKRCSPEYKKIASNLYVCSPLAYKYIRPYLELPNEHTIYRVIGDVPSGIITEHFNTLELAVKQMDPLKKLCNICVHYVPINAVQGTNKFEKNKSLYRRHEIDGVVTDLPAKCAVVIAVTGVVVRWRQVLGYALTAGCQHYPELIAWIEKVITKLIDIELDVRCLVTNTSTFFWSYIVSKKISGNKPYFKIAGKKILYILDVPHLIRSARNVLMKNNFKFLDGKVAKWSDVLEVYEKTQSRLTQKHMFPSGTAKTTTAFAAQTFSRSVAKAIENLVTQNVLEPEAKDTAELLLRFNTLFDILNSTLKQPYCAKSDQKHFLEDTILFLDSLKINNVRLVRFAKGFIITIRSVMVLYDDLEGVDTLRTRNINLDSIDVLFKNTRRIGAISFLKILFKFSLKDSLKLRKKEAGEWDE